MTKRTPEQKANLYRAHDRVKKLVRELSDEGIDQMDILDAIMTVGVTGCTRAAGYEGAANCLQEWVDLVRASAPPVEPTVRPPTTTQ